MRVEDYLEVTDYKYYDIRSSFNNGEGTYDDQGNMSKGLAKQKYGNFHIDEISHMVRLEGVIDTNHKFNQAIMIIPVLWISA